MPLNKWIPNFRSPLVIAGPCSAESEEQVLATAHDIAKLEGVKVFRAGVWKPRTRPGTFEGVGEKALPWLAKVKEQYGMLTSVEVATPKHVEDSLKHGIDIMWIGARTTVNPFAVSELAEALRGTGVPVMVKNPINADLGLWIGALERMSRMGISKLAAIHRGFSIHEKSQYRNAPIWKIPIELKSRYPELPVICDASHISGRRDLIEKVSQKAMDLDMEGLMIETHIDPSVALSDAAQQVTPKVLGEILANLDYKVPYSTDSGFENELESLRARIDRTDHELLELLHGRMKIVEKIADAKIKSNITAFQVTRMKEMMDERVNVGEKFGLSKEYVMELLRVIHEYSVKRQTDLMDRAHVEKSEGKEK